MEVLIAIFVIGTGLLTVYSMFILSSTIIGRSHRTNQAYLVANRAIEQLRAQPFSSLANGVTTETVPELPSASLTRTISSYNSDSNLKQIDISVIWQDKGQPKNIDIVSLATPRGINN